MKNIVQECKMVSIRELMGIQFTIPHYQRENTWSTKQKQFLLDSIIKGYPITSFLLCKSSDELSFDIVDAKHRYQTICEFKNNKLPYTFYNNDGKRINLFYGTDDESEKEIIYNTYNNVSIMSSDMRSEFDSFNIILQIFSSEDNEVNAEIFKRVNTSGKKASKAEIKASQTSGSDYHVMLNSILKASENIPSNLKLKVLNFFECLDKEKTGTTDLRYSRLTNDKSIKSLKYSNIFHKIEVYCNIANNIVENIAEPYDKLIFKIPNINSAVDEIIDSKFELTEMDAIHDFNTMYNNLSKAVGYFGGKFSINKKTFNETIMCVFTALVKTRSSEIGPLFSTYWIKNFDTMCKQAETNFPHKSVDSAGSIVRAFKFVNEYFDYAINKVEIGGDELGK